MKVLLTREKGRSNVEAGQFPRADAHRGKGSSEGDDEGNGKEGRKGSVKGRQRRNGKARRRKSEHGKREDSSKGKRTTVRRQRAACGGSGS